MASLGSVTCPHALVADDQSQGLPMASSSVIRVRNIDDSRRPSGNSIYRPFSCGESHDAPFNINILSPT